MLSRGRGTIPIVFYTVRLPSYVHGLRCLSMFLSTTKVDSQYGM